MKDDLSRASIVVAKLKSSTLDQVRIGFDIQLVFGTPGGILQIESAAFLRYDGASIKLDATEDPTSTSAVLSLLRTSVECVDLSERRLQLRFSSGEVFEVCPDEDYESWSLTGDDGGRVVCMPGGELAVWNAPG